MAVPNPCVDGGRDLMNCLERGSGRWDHLSSLSKRFISLTRGMGMQERENEAEHSRQCMSVFVSVNITSLFIVHWTLFMQGLVLPNLEELFPCLKPRTTSWPAGDRGQLKAAALGSYRTLRTLKELSLIRRKPVCTWKEVCETCVSYWGVAYLWEMKNHLNSWISYHLLVI